MKIKDLDEETRDYYCAAHICEECPLNKISNELCISCFALLGHIKEHSDREDEISILAKEEWLYLRAVIEPFQDIVKNIKISTDTIHFSLVNRPSCDLIRCFDFKGLIKDKAYTLHELDL